VPKILQPWGCTISIHKVMVKKIRVNICVYIYTLKDFLTFQTLITIGYLWASTRRGDNHILIFKAIVISIIQVAASLSGEGSFHFSEQSTKHLGQSHGESHMFRLGTTLVNISPLMCSVPTDWFNKWIHFCAKIWWLKLCLQITKLENKNPRIKLFPKKIWNYVGGGGG
jgi:hypothetical protein